MLGTIGSSQCLGDDNLLELPGFGIRCKAMRVCHCYVVVMESLGGEFDMSLKV